MNNQMSPQMSPQMQQATQQALQMPQQAPQMHMMPDGSMMAGPAHEGQMPPQPYVKAPAVDPMQAQMMQAAMMRQQAPMSNNSQAMPSNPQGMPSGY
tara:strand:+ start:235 stop:525 length:291 start_codon:yes stop_codon:yes gene_type:complete